MKKNLFESTKHTDVYKTLCCVDKTDVLLRLELPFKQVCFVMFSTFLLALYINAFLGYCEVSC